MEEKSLQEKYDYLVKSTNLQLRQYCDEVELLSDLNHKLQEENTRLKQLLAKYEPNPSLVDETKPKVPEDLLEEGTGIYPEEEITKIDKLHQFGNLLSVDTHKYKPEIVFTGGVDKFVCVHNWKTQSKLTGLDMGAPCLEVKCCPLEGLQNYALVACMDSKVHLIELVSTENSYQLVLRQTFTDHNRVGALRVTWNTTGTGFASASCDKSVHMYKKGVAECDTSPRFVKEKSFFFNGVVESLVYVPRTELREAEQLLISVRSDCYLHYVDCSTLEKTRLNMNVDGIEHVSYTIMDMAVSPNAKYILAATDTNRHLLFEVGTNVVLRDFYGHDADSYSQPRLLWHPSGKYIISNSEKNGEIFIWSVASLKVVRKLSTHSALVRDLQIFTDADDKTLLITVSYDKTLKVWQ